MKIILLACVMVAACSKPRAAQPLPPPDDDLARQKALIASLVEKVPAPTPPPTTKKCPAALKGNLYLLEYELALRIRDRAGLPASVFIDHDEPVYDLVRYAAGQQLESAARQRAATLESKSPAFVRISELSLPTNEGGKPVDGKLSAAIFVLDRDGSVACQLAFKLRTVEEGEAESPSEFAATASAAIRSMLLEL